MEKPKPEIDAALDLAEALGHRPSDKELEDYEVSAPEQPDAMPSISPRALKIILGYVYALAPRHEDLAEEERRVIGKDEFEALREWACKEQLSGT